MRTIPEVAEDIKSILNNIERTQECNGETLVDIDELVNEIITINCYKDEPHTNADLIRSMNDEELAEFLEQFEVCSHCEYGDNERCTFENPCVHEFATAMALKWLQSEAEWQKGAI